MFSLKINKILPLEKCVCFMRGSRNFRQWGPGQSNKKSSDNIFFFLLVLRLLYSNQMVQHFPGGGGGGGRGPFAYSL